MMDVVRSLARLVAVIAMGASAAIGQASGLPEPPRFVERPGVLEFSGQLIVRPLQPAALARRGLADQEIAAIRARAAERLRADLIESISQTDEYIVGLPPGETENDLAARLMATGDYQYAEPNWICHATATVPNDPAFGSQWHHQKLGSPSAWDHVTGDAGIVIAIVDGGVALDHPDLTAALVPGYNAADRIAQADGGDVYDVDGHGTFIAGIVGATGNNGVDVVGMGWDLSIMPVRYYNSPGGGFLHDLLDGARWAADHGARCVNVSQTGVENASVQTTGEYVRDRGGLLLYAAGNDGQDLSWFDWPDVLVVGGTDQDDDLLSDAFVTSGHGLAVDVYAPGADMLSTFVNSTGGLGLGIGSGTSSSVAVASGLCGLAWSLRPDFTTQQVEQILFAGCEDLGPPGEDTFWGWGRVHSSGSISAALDAMAWHDQGCALAGVSGDPRLVGSGLLTDGSSNSVDLSHAAPSALAGVFVAFSSSAVPFKGGTLKPFPFLDPALGSTGPTGELPLPFVMPPGAPSGTELWVQWAIQDAAAIHGVSLSNALLGVTP
jgi:subtilisin family serine protease